MRNGYLIVYLSLSFVRVEIGRQTVTVCHDFSLATTLSN